MTPVEFEPIASTAPEGWRVIAIGVPPLAGGIPMFRIIADVTSFKFRVEQIDATGHKSNVYKWVARSAHAGDFAFESYPAAINDMLAKQARFKEKVKLAQHEARMAQIKAQNPLGSK